MHDNRNVCVAMHSLPIALSLLARRIVPYPVGITLWAPTVRYSRSRHSLVRLQLGDREALHHQLEQIEHERQACLPALPCPALP